MEKKSELNDLKKSYMELREKYNLPSFEELNAEFNIEKASGIETDSLAREIRKFVAEKFSNYLRFSETLLHPVDVPMFIFAVVKSLGIEEKKRLSEIYKKLAEKEIQIIELDIEFSEKKEAEFIKESYETWKEIKQDLLKIIGIIKKNWDVKAESNGKNYFG
jgi:hypothetical protein